MKGKYANRADTRLKVLESETLRDAAAKIADLQTQLAAARQELNTYRAKMQGQALKAAAGMSAREKQNLRDKIASLEHQAAEQRVRNAVLTWEVMHRAKFDRPSPTEILGMGTIDARLDGAPEPREELQESFEYWCAVHWEIAALFLSDYDEILEFCRIAEGYTWGVAGDKTLGANAREATRNFRKGRVRDHMLKRIYAMREYYDRIWQARLAGHVEPVIRFRYILGNADEAPTDRRDQLVEKIRARGEA